jgi:hypothetical protein
MAFWRKLLMAFQSMNFKRSKADPCLYYSRKDGGLVLWVSWINDCLVLENKKVVMKAKQMMINIFDSDIINGYSVFLNKAPISMKSGQQKSVTLYSAESELVLVHSACKIFSTRCKY